MMHLGTIEFVLLLLYVVGLLCVAVGAVTQRFRSSETIAAAILAVALPGIGSLFAIGLLAVRMRRAGSTLNERPSPGAT